MTAIATISAPPSVVSAPRWPVWIAPLAAGVYYLSLRGGFAHSIDGVVFDASDVNLSDIGAPQWGSHWIYRTLAETVSLAFGTFVAAGIARQRAKLAAQIGGLSISTVYTLINANWFYCVYLEHSYVSIEPWYQHLVEAGIILGAPFMGSAIGELYRDDIFKPSTIGFAGVNRFHFIWLWFVTSFYINLLASAAPSQTAATSTLRQRLLGVDCGPSRSVRLSRRLRRFRTFALNDTTIT
jgi:hypothetical protein